MYRFNTRIPYSETGTDMKLRADALIDNFQNCSTFQTIDSPVGMDVLKERGLAWVINSWQIDINRLPSLGERVIVGTIPYEMKGFLGLRNFFMDTEEGERLAAANSVWSLINIEKASPVRVTPDIMAAYPLDERLDMEYLPRKLVIPGDDKGAECTSFTIQEKHLDSNLHVNNVQYIRMALDCIAQEKGEKRTPVRIRADYRQQARLGDEVIPRIFTDDQGDGRAVYLVTLDNTDKSAYAVVEITVSGS